MPTELVMVQPVATLSRQESTRDSSGSRDIDNTKGGGSDKGGRRLSVMKRLDASFEPAIQIAKIVEQNKKDVKRIFTIAYRVYLNRLMMNIEFAASIFKNEAAFPAARAAAETTGKNKPKKECYSRKNHIATAKGRLNVRPLYVTFPIENRFHDVLRMRPEYPKREIIDASGTLSHRKRHELWMEQLKKNEEYITWSTLYHEFHDTLKHFLRRQIAELGTGAKIRLRPSTVERARKEGKNPYEATGKTGHSEKVRA